MNLVYKYIMPRPNAKTTVPVCTPMYSLWNKLKSFMLVFNRATGATVWGEGGLLTAFVVWNVLLEDLAKLLSVSMQ